MYVSEWICIKIFWKNIKYQFFRFVIVLKKILLEMVFVMLTTLTLVVDLMKGIAVMNLWLEIMNVMMATELPNVNLMEVTAAQMSWLEMEYAQMSTIFQPVKTMMEVTVDHQTLLIGQNVPIILH